ncbi:MAG: thioredoxin family protein, partial [Chloroflexota bacterium]
MLERLGIAVAVLAMIYFGYQLVRCYSLWRAAKQAPADPLLKNLRRGIPAVLYFTTPTCAPCKYAQRPALHKLQTQLGD